MKRAQFIIIAVLIALSGTSCAQTTSYGKRLARLNPTINLDKLAGDRLVLDNCLCTNSICSPSLATI